MRKIATIFLLMVSLCLVFAGVVSAKDPSVQVGVLGEINPGNTVAIDVLANANDEQVVDPYVTITVDPETSLNIDNQNALMSVNGINWVSNSDPISGGFLSWKATDEEWVWDIGQFGNLDAGESAELWVPALVTGSGEIKVSADLIGANMQTRQYEILASDLYTFLPEETRHGTGPGTPVDANTVPMQTTGAPLALAALGLLSIISGTVYGKLR